VEGIDRIKRHILAEAEAEATALLEETERFSEKELANAHEERETILKEAAERAQEEAGLLIKRGEGVADALNRKRRLERRQALADEVIQRALDLLCAKPAAERVALYASWVKALGLEEGEITLAASERDELAGPLLGALPGGRFTISADGGAFSGGLIVTCGRVRDNLTYDMLVRDHRPWLAKVALEHLDTSGDGADG